MVKSQPSQSVVDRGRATGSQPHQLRPLGKGRSATRHAAHRGGSGGSQWPGGLVGGASQSSGGPPHNSRGGYCHHRHHHGVLSL